MTETKEEDKEQESAQAELKQLTPGQVSITGHFTGSVTTFSHCIEVAVPINAVVPSTAVCPLLGAFAEASESPDDNGSGKAEEVSNESPNAYNSFKKLWADLLKLIAVDSACLELQAAVESTDTQEQADMLRHVSGASMGRQTSWGRKTSPSEEVLQMDFEAKEALLKEVMMERDALRKETEQLKEDLESGTLGRMFKKGTSLFRHKEEEEGQEDDDDASSHDSRENSRSPRPRISHRAKSAPGQGSRRYSHASSEAEEAPPELPPEPEHVHLHGQFVGWVRTMNHLLEITLPLRGSLPVHAVLEIADALSHPPLPSGQLSCMHPDEHGHAHHAALHETSEVFERLHRLIAGEYPEQENGRRNLYSSMARAQTAEAVPESQPKEPPTFATPERPAHSPGMALVDVSLLETRLKELEQLALQLTGSGSVRV